MKTLRNFLLAALLIGQGVAPAEAITAYEALISVGRQKGDAFLDSLIEMRGENGTPQPGQWTLLFRDDSARAGLREFVVSNQGILSERTPVRAEDALLVAATMPHATLKLDSNGAFTKANKLANDARLGFDAAGYRLHSLNGAPVWTLRLLDADRREAGVTVLSAKDGAVIKPLTSAASASATSASATPAPAATPGAASDARPLSERWVEGGGLVGHITRWSERTWDTTTNAAGGAGRNIKDTAGEVGRNVGAFFVGQPNSGSPAPANPAPTSPATNRAAGLPDD